MSVLEGRTVVQPMFGRGFGGTKQNMFGNTDLFSQKLTFPAVAYFAGGRCFNELSMHSQTGIILTLVDGQGAPLTGFAEKGEAQDAKCAGMALSMQTFVLTACAVVEESRVHASKHSSADLHTQTFLLAACTAGEECHTESIICQTTQWKDTLGHWD